MCPLARTVHRSVRDAWLILGLSALLGVAIEIAARALAARPESDPRARAAAHAAAPWTEEVFAELHASERLRWEPYVGWRRLPFASRFTNVDARGRRLTVPRAAPGAKRVLFFGGSTIWGTGARDEATIPSLVARATGWDVSNEGETGYVATQERFLLERALQDGERPDLVVFYDGVNDVYAAYQSHRAGLPQNEPNRAREFNLTKRPGRLLAEALRASLHESASVALATRFLGPGAPPPALPAEERRALAAAIARAYAANVTDLVALARARGFAVAFFLQPVIFTKRALAPDERAFARERAFVAELYRDAYEAIRAARLPCFHDLSDCFGDDATPRFFDFCHLAESGDAVVAQHLLAALREP